MPDTIIQEIRKTRDEYARQFNYDLHQMCLDLRREQELSGATVVTFSTKAIQTKLAQHLYGPTLSTERTANAVRNFEES